MTQLPQWLSKLHHDGSEYYVSNPLPKLGETIRLKLRAPQDAPINYIFIRAMLDGEFKMFRMERINNDDDTVQWWAGDLPVEQHRIDYRFKIMTDDGAYYYTAQGIRRGDSPDFESFIILGDYDAPLWVRDTVYYQIFPERFWNGDESNDVQDDDYTLFGYSTTKAEWGTRPTPWEKSRNLDFFGGDLQGITQKLDYLSEVGINGIYLCPIFESDTNHRYDIKDFFKIDDSVGGNAALAELRQATQERDIKLMLDITPNHVSFQHPWVLDFQNNSDSETGEYFYYDETTGEFEKWFGVSLLIKLNYSSQKLRDIMYRSEDSALKHWLKPPYSIDAWRLDVANMTGNRGTHQLDHEVWNELKTSVKEYKSDTYLLGEYFQDSTMHLQGDELDATMNYQGFNMPLRRWLGGEDLAGHDKPLYSDTAYLTTEAMAEQWQAFMGAVAYPITLQQFNQLDSHDTTRILHVVDGDKDLVKLGLGLMMGFPGVPCIYYGTEIGMDGFKDPDNRRCMTFDESEWDTDMLDYTKRIIRLRYASPAIKHGSFEILQANGDLIAYLRQSSEQTIIVVGYRGTTPFTNIGINLSDYGLNTVSKAVDLLSDTQVTIKGGVLNISEITHGQAMLIELN